LNPFTGETLPYLEIKGKPVRGDKDEYNSGKKKITDFSYKLNRRVASNLDARGNSELNQEVSELRKANLELNYTEEIGKHTQAETEAEVNRMVDEEDGKGLMVAMMMQKRKATCKHHKAVWGTLTRKSKKYGTTTYTGWYCKSCREKMNSEFSANTEPYSRNRVTKKTPIKQDGFRKLVDRLKGETVNKEFRDIEIDSIRTPKVVGRIYD